MEFVEKISESSFIVNSEYIVSAFCNPIEYAKAKKYSVKMLADDILHGKHFFPPIEGFPKTITKEDIGSYFIRGEDEICDHDLIDESFIGKTLWFVTEGHHRVMAMRMAYCKSNVNSFKFTEAILDKSGFVKV